MFVLDSSTVLIQFTGTWSWRRSVYGCTQADVNAGTSGTKKKYVHL